MKGVVCQTYTQPRPISRLARGQPCATIFFIVRITIIYFRIIVYTRAKAGGIRDSCAVPNEISSGSCAPLGFRTIAICSGAGPALLQTGWLGRSAAVCRVRIIII